MSAPTPELTAALSQVLDKIDGAVRGGGYSGPPIVMYLAGGLAVNYYCGSRYTEDIDASFSRRLLLPEKDLMAAYTRGDGSSAVLYIDSNYNPTFALMHPDYQRDSSPWEGIGNERRMVQLHVLSPVDLAVAKISRASEQDREDIRTLGRHRLVTAPAIQRRAEEAMGYYIGNPAAVRTNVEEICREIAAIEAEPAAPGATPDVGPSL